MGASPLMSIGMSAMAANYAALQVTGHNIANANVAGYSRQRVELATAQGQFSGAGFFVTRSDLTGGTTHFTRNGSLQIDSDRYVWPHLLDEVSRNLPSYTWLTSLTSQKSRLQSSASAASCRNPTIWTRSGRT